MTPTTLRRRTAAARMLAGLSTFMFLLAVFIAAWTRPDMPLSLLLLGLGRGTLGGLHALVDATLPDGAWDAVFVRLLDRPGWLIPGMAALVAGGLAITVNPRPDRPRR